jgi:hypothetical protein
VDGTFDNEVDKTEGVERTSGVKLNCVLGGGAGIFLQVDRSFVRLPGPSNQL